MAEKNDNSSKKIGTIIKKKEEPFDKLKFPGNKKKGPDAYADITRVIKQWLSDDDSGN